MADVKVTVLRNGPLRVEGVVEVVDPEGGRYGLKGRTKLSLCRCGHSANKPFCDGSHAREGFDSECKAFDLPDPKS
jgi:CDGSH-type Zn-finger protein